MNLSTAHIPVTFKVHYATRWGQIVTVIGDDEAFGKWNTKKGARMNYIDAGNWQLTVFKIRPSDIKEIRYKYAIIDTLQPDLGIPHLEPGIDRAIDFSSDNKQIVREDHWGEMPKTQQITWDKWPFTGSLFRSPMPLSHLFDPGHTVFDEWSLAKIDVVISFADPDECKASTGGLAVIIFPIEDLHTPKNPEAFSALLQRIADLLAHGLNIVLHCHAGIGRTGLTICCLAKQCGFVGDLISWIRKQVRGAVQTPEQERWVTEF